MDIDFQPSPHEEAARLIEGKPVVAARVFRDLLPELRARAFTVAGIEAANVLQRVRDEVAALPRGQTWADSKAEIVDALSPYLTPEGADRRADLILRVNGFQAFAAATWRVAQEDDDTTHLQYLHGECDVPTPSHLALDEIVLPKRDPFWITHFGPWGHLGCVCTARGMNIDQVEAEKAKDEKRNPEDRMVFEGPMLKRLNEGQLIRGPRSYDVLPPTGDGAFAWHPGDLRISLEQLRQRYDPEVFAEFEAMARRTFVDYGVSLWDWLGAKIRPRFAGGKLGRPPLRREKTGSTGNAETLALPTAGSLPTIREGVGWAAEKAARAQLAQGVSVRSAAGPEVRFGEIALQHLDRVKEQNPNDLRARFLPAAMATVEDPLEVWENDLRRTYIGRFDKLGKKAFVVITARHGETLDQALTFMPKSDKELERLREGKLIYRKTVS